MTLLSNIKHILDGNDFDSLLKELQSLKGILRSTKAEKTRLSNTNVKLRSENESLNSKNVTLSEDLERERNKYAILENKFNILSSSNKELCKDNDRLLAKEAKLEDNLLKIKEKNASLNGKCLSLSNKIKSMDSLLIETQSKLGKKEAECDDQSTIIKQLNDSINEKSKLLVESNALTDKLSEDLQNSENDKGQLMNQLNKAKDQNIKLVDQSKDDKTQIVTLSKSVKKLSTQVSNLDTELQEKKLEVEKLTASVSDKIHTIETQNVKVEELTDLNQKLSKEKDGLLNTNSVLSDKLSVKESSIESLKSEISTLTDNNKELCSDLDATNAEKDEILHNLEFTQSKYETLEGEMSVFKSQFNKLKTNYEQTKHELVDQKEITDKITHEKESITKDLEISKSQNKSLEGKVSTLESQKTELETIYEHTKQELETQKKLVDQLSKEKESLAPYMYLIEEKKEQERQEKALFEAKQKLNSLIVSAKEKTQLFNHENIIEKLNNAISIAEDALNKSIVDDIENAYVELENELGLLEHEDQELTRQDEEEQALAESKNSLRTLIKSAEDKVKNIEYEEIKNNLISEINAATIVLNDDSVTKIDIDNAYNKLNDSISNCENKIIELNAIEEARQRKIKELSALRESLLALITSAVNFLNTITYPDIADNLRYVVNKAKECSENEASEYDEISQKIDLLKTAVNNAKDEIRLAIKTENHIVKRSILEVFDKKEGEIIESSEFFQRSQHELIHWRRIFEESVLYGEHRFICTNCRQDVKISGRKFARGQVEFFSHLHDSDFCELKTTTGLSKEQIEARKYGLVGESLRHKTLKGLIHEALEGYTSRLKGVSNVVEEKRIDSNIPYMNWRKPDVQARYNDLNIVFELQLSTTFVSVVVQRDIFYRLNNYFIIWVFNFDDNKKYVDLTNLMCQDIYYANKRNIFIFDKDAQEASREREELVLKCNWLDCDNTWHYSIDKGNGDGILVSLDELKFDEETSKPYYYDAETPYYELHPSVKERIQKEERSKKDMLDSLQARADREAEENALKRELALKKIIEDNGAVVPFKDGSRFGFKYLNTILINARFSSYSPFGDNGMYKVSFNRHFGLIDKYGNELFKCNYLNFHRLSNGLIVAESTSGFYISGIGRLCERAPHDSISVRQLSPEISVFTHNTQDLEVYIIDDECILKKEQYVSWSFYDLLGNKIYDVSYNNIKFTNGYTAIWARRSVTDSWKLLELNGTEKISKSYSKCSFEKDVTIACNEGQSDIYNLDGELISETQYDDIKPFKLATYYTVSKNGSCGIINKECKEIIPILYTQIEVCGSYIVALKDGKWQIYDRDGISVSENVYDGVEIFVRYEESYHDWVIVRRNGLYGLFNNKSEEILSPEFESISRDRWFLIVKKDGLFGLYNYTGEKILDPKYESISKELDFFIVKQNDKLGMYNSKGSKLLQIEYDCIEKIENNANIRCKTGDQWQLYLVQKQELIGSKYDSISGLNYEYIKIGISGKFGVINSLCELRIPTEYDDVEMFKFVSGYIYNTSCTYNEKIFKCKISDKWGAYSIENNCVVIPIEYDDVNWWHEDVFKVKINLCWGLYEQSKSLLTKVKYSKISGYDDTKVCVSITDGISSFDGHISPEGKEIFSDIKELGDGITTNEFFGKWGLYDHGNIIIPCESIIPIQFFGHGLYKVQDGGKFGLKNKNNEWIFDPSYREILGEDNASYVIVKLIRYKRERKYTWGRSYHMIDVEYNEYQLYNIDGTQNGIPSQYKESYKNMYFGGPDFVYADGNILSLSNFKISSDNYSACQKIGNKGFTMVTSKGYNGKFGILNYNLQLVLPCEYDGIVIWGNNLFLAKKTVYEKVDYWTSKTRDEYSLFKDDGTLCSIGSFSSIEDIVEGKAKVTIWRHTGYIDSDGEIISEKNTVMDNEITVLHSFGWIEVKNMSGEVLLPLSAHVSNITPLCSSFYIIRKYSKYGVLGTNGNIIECNFDSIEIWSDYIVKVSMSQNDDNDECRMYTYKLLSLNNDTNVSQLVYSNITSLVDGFATAQRNGLTGKINSYGQEVSDLEESINDSLTKRRIFGQWGVFNIENKKIIPVNYSDISLYNDNIIVATTNKSSYPYSQVKYLFRLTGEKIIETGINAFEECNNGYYILSNGTYQALYDKDFKEVVSFSRSYLSIKQWSETKFVVTKNEGSYYSSTRFFYIIDENGEIVSKNKYSAISNLDNGQAEVVLNNKKGYINEYCEELPDQELNRQEWNIKSIFGQTSVSKGETVVLSNLKEADFITDYLIMFKKQNNLYYNLYSLKYQKVLPSSYEKILEFDGGKAKAINANKFNGYIDENGNEIYESSNELTEGVCVKLKFGKYDLYINETMVLSDMFHISLWTKNRLRIGVEKNKFQIYNIEIRSFIGCKYQYICNLEDNKAKVSRDGTSGCIDVDANEIPDAVLVLKDKIKKVKTFGKWNILNINGEDLLKESFYEIGSYKGRFVKLERSSFRVLESKCPVQVPVIGDFYKECKSTLIYLVGGYYVRVQIKTLNLNDQNTADYIKEHQSLKLVINYINFKKHVIYGKPYMEQKQKVYIPFEIDEIVEGEIYKIHPFGVRIKTNDGRLTLIHKSRLEEINYSDFTFEIGQKISIVKKGYDEIHKSDIWSILKIE